MEDLYDNIGGKIKNLALTIFVLEAIACIICGFVMIFNEMFLAGVLALIVGPIVSWIGSWLLYAFGELVKRTADNEYNTSKILKLMEAQGISQPQAVLVQAQSVSKPQAVPAQEQSVSQRQEQPQNRRSSHSWRCDNCGKMATQSPCEHCGEKLGV